MFLQTASLRRFAGAVFIYLVLVKIEVLTFPFYGDAIGGPCAEGFWLAQHNLNYWQLFHEPTYTMGGPKVYLTSIFPAFLAIGLRLLINIKLYLAVNHLVVFAEGAITVAVLRQILRRNFKDADALLVAITLLSFPLFQSQVEAINMEMPMVMFSVLATDRLITRRMCSAAIFAMLAALVKGVAVLICAVVFVTGIIVFLTDTKKEVRRSGLIWGSAALGFALLDCLAVTWIFRNDGRMSLMGWMRGWESIRHMLISAIYAISLVVLIGASRQWMNQARREKAAAVLQRVFPTIVMFLCAGAWFAFFLNATAVSPRYRLLLIPFTIYCAYWAASLLMQRWPRFLRVMVVGSILFFFIVSYGVTYPRAAANNHVILERSLEYRNDIKLNMKLAKILQDRYNNEVVAAPFSIAQQLAIPALGYVKAPLNVMVYGITLQYGGIHNFQGINHMPGPTTIWIAGEDDLKNYKDYPMGPKDTIEDTLYMGDKYVVLFRGGYIIDRVWQVIKLRKIRDFVLKSRSQAPPGVSP
jgi:hypothetical protein